MWGSTFITSMHASATWKDFTRRTNLSGKKTKQAVWHDCNSINVSFCTYKSGSHPILCCNINTVHIFYTTIVLFRVRVWVKGRKIGNYSMVSHVLSNLFSQSHCCCDFVAFSFHIMWQHISRGTDVGTDRKSAVKRVIHSWSSVCVCVWERCCKICTWKRTGRVWGKEKWRNERMRARQNRRE